MANDKQGMTFADAVKSGTSKIRQPYWQPNAYIELHLLPDGYCGPWVKLYDQPTQEVIGVESPQTLLVTVVSDMDGWEKFEKAND